MKFLNSKLQRKNRNGFTLSELLVVVGILIVLTAISIPAFRFFEGESDLNNSTEEIINTLRIAQNKTLASESSSRWGVYFSTSTIPHQYILFQGNNYQSRSTSSDEVHKLPSKIEIYKIDLSSAQEVVFNRLSGTTDQFGEVAIRLKTNFVKTRNIFIQTSGQITLGVQAAPGETNRIKDSRHVHFDYSRNIATSTEILKLTFTYDSSTVTKNIVIGENLKDNQIYWEGEVEVGGEIQKLKIHTHRLNNPDTQFSIHRDRRYNTRALTIEISGDITGNLIQYDASGQTTKGISIYVTNPIWQ